MTIAERDRSIGAIGAGAGAGVGGPLASKVDKLLDNRVRVTVGCDLNTAHTAGRVIDTKLDSVAYSAIADVITGW